MTGAVTGMALIVVLAALAGPANAAEHAGTDIAAALVRIAGHAAATGEFRKAADYAQKAARHGNGAGIALLAEFRETGKAMPKDVARAAALYRKALAAGFHPAGARLGYLYLNGLGIARDTDAAGHWFRHTTLLLPRMEDRAGFLTDWMAERGVPTALGAALV